MPLEDVYRQLYNRDLYLEAYARIYKNDGAMTKGTTEETVDGMSLRKIDAIIEELRHERFKWTSVRRVYIPKANGKTRPLGIPTWTDKLLQEVMRQLLEAYYEPQFSKFSHGFRPGRGCGTALKEIGRVWRGTKWFIEGDIKGCFDNINHERLMGILGENIHDGRFLRLVQGLLRAGYMENWKYNQTLSGTLQGGVISPLLSNIYLDRLDEYVQTVLIPEHNKGEQRSVNIAFSRLAWRIKRLRQAGDHEEADRLKRERDQIPSLDTNDPNYRRLRYVRYADDFLLGFAGPRAEAEEIKGKIKDFLRDDLKLEMSEEKTLVTHAKTEQARFLSYDISTMQENSRRDANGNRCINGGIALRMPPEKLEARCSLYKKNGEPIHRVELVNDSDYDIMTRYQSELRGFYQYYQLAQNANWCHTLHWVMETSLLKTLANKHKSSVSKMFDLFKSKIKVEDGQRRCLEVVVLRGDKRPLVIRFGGIPFKYHPTANIEDVSAGRAVHVGRSELLDRLCASECEVCGKTTEMTDLEVHHIRKLADLDKPGRKTKASWMKLMSARRRKTLVLCIRCHDDLHAGRPMAWKVKGN